MTTTMTLPSERSSTGRGAISVRALRKAYGASRPVLDGITLEVAPAQFTSIVGPSGVGKTTLLRCLAGLLPPTSGEVRLDGEVVDRPPATVAPVFQDYSRSLLPWMRVGPNVELPLLGKRSKADRRRLVDEALQAVGLADVADRYPWQLSGGMQQRVAIARALAYEPEAMLMDEPFASVDAQTRADLEDLMLSVRDRYAMTVVLVTHDIDEAIYMSDRVVVLSGAPARMVAEIPVELDKPRHQLRTKADPRFAELRAQVFGLIRGRRT